MAGEQAFSPTNSMDEEKDQQLDEVWSELSKPYRKEFDLPDLSDPLSPDPSEKYADFDDLTSNLIDVPIGIDETIFRATIHPFRGENLPESLEILEDVAKENNLFEVPIFDGISYDLDLNEFITGKKPEFFNKLDLPSSVGLRDPKTNPTDVHISGAEDQSKGIPGSPNKSSSGSNDFTFDNPAFPSSPRNEVACDPITNTTNVGPLGLNSSALTMEIPGVGLYEFLGTGGKGQAFGLPPLQVGDHSGEDGIPNHDQRNSGGGQGYLITGRGRRPLFEPVNFQETETKGNNFSIQGKGRENLGGETKTDGNEVSVLGKGKEKIPIPSQGSKRLKQDKGEEEKNSNGFWGMW